MDVTAMVADGHDHVGHQRIASDVEGLRDGISDVLIVLGPDLEHWECCKCRYSANNLQDLCPTCGLGYCPKCSLVDSSEASQ